jgi:predicted NBD/HSP70 family sugar kinase
MFAISPKISPPLDPQFLPASLWNRGYRCAVNTSGGAELAFALERSDGSVSTFRTTVLPHEGPNIGLNQRYAERLVKFLLWQKGGYRITVAGGSLIAAQIAAYLRSVYSAEGARSFDHRFLGEQIYGHTLTIEESRLDNLPEEKEVAGSLGRHLDGYRIGFDLGASDRKCAAVAQGKVTFSEEVPWSPGTQADPGYHFDGINDSLQRAAVHLPRVDAIGGSAAGVYVANEVRAGSLYRSVPPALFESCIRRLFFDLQRHWGGIPFEVVNDGEVTALAGSMAVQDNAVLGIAMGSSLAAGFVTLPGGITTWLNELAFVPVDYREDAPRDEWSGDTGVGVQYLSQQAVGRLLEPAGIELPSGMPLPAKLEEVQKLVAAGDRRAYGIYETIGAYFGYAIGHFADFYEFRNLLVLGRVMTGEGGNIILAMARRVLETDFPELSERVRFHIPDEQEKRHGQAIAAASLPAIP